MLPVEDMFFYGSLGDLPVASEGLYPVAEKVEAIKDAPEPQNRSELKSYLGLLSYYSRIMPNMSTTLAPLLPLART